MIQSYTIQAIQEIVHTQGILKQSIEKLLLRFLETCNGEFKQHKIAPYKLNTDNLDTTILHLYSKLRRFNACSHH